MLSASSIEPFTSAKSTVTCLRSPSRAGREVRIFSARCLGVYERGSGAAASIEGSGIRWPHESQNFCPLSLGVPHFGQKDASVSGAAHSLQNFAPSRFSWPQAAHFMTRAPCRRGSFSALAEQLVGAPGPARHADLVELGDCEP